jgi:hypothetical protein
MRADQLPDEQMRRDFERIRTKLTSATPTGNEGTVVATLRNINDEDARPSSAASAACTASFMIA